MIRNAVMNAHPLSANAAYDTTLQKRWALACRPGISHSSESHCVLGEALLVHLKLLPTDVACIDAGNYKLPVCLGNPDRAVLAVRQKARAYARRADEQMPTELRS